MGENGAGKSTLIRILSGDQAADTGEITIDGSSNTIRQSAMLSTLA
jgi:L-arabinose transport system ATP-binding protein